MGESFGRRLRALRKYYGLTQAALADYLSLPDGSYTVNRSTLTNIELGREVPSIEFVIRVARVFRVSLDYLLRDFDVDALDRILPRYKRMGFKVRQLREAHHLTQDAVARALELKSRAYLSNIERGERYPSVDVLTRIADYFHVSIDMLIDDTHDLDLSQRSATSSDSS